MLGARAAYHVDFEVENLDAYSGILAGYSVVNSSITGDDAFATGSASSSFFMYGFYVGSRYYFNPSFAIFGEIGYGIGLINLGATFNF